MTEPTVDSWEAHARAQREAWRRLTYAQRLAWLEEAKAFVSAACGAPAALVSTTRGHPARTARDRPTTPDARVVALGAVSGERALCP